MPSTRSTIIAYLVCAFVWGTTWFAIRVCIGPGGYPTLLAAALRFTLAAAVLAPLVWRARPWPTRAQWPWLVAAGALDAVGYALVYMGEERVPGGLAAVLFGTQPLILAGLLTATGFEAIRPADVIGALISLGGVGLIFLDRLDVSAPQATGVALVLGSVFVSSAYSMIMKKHGVGIHALVSTAVFITVTAACLWIVVAIRGSEAVPWPLPLRPTLALVYLAIAGSVIAFGAYFWLLARVSLMTTGSLVFVLPVVALFVDAIFEQHVRLSGRAYLGIAVVLAGLGCTLLLKRFGSGPVAVVEPLVEPAG